MTLNRLPSLATASRHGRRTGFALLVTGSGAVAAVSPVPPTIKVNPNNVMVNTDTKVTGHHFTPGSTVSLSECSETSWIAPQDPCNTNNTKTVTVDAKGRFHTKMKVEECPAVSGPVGVSERCYIGVTKPTGVDTVELQPYAGIVVTGP